MQVVRAPGGEVWEVRRLWFGGRRVRWRGRDRDRDLPDVGDLGGDDPLSFLLLLVVGVVVAVLLALFVVPLLLFLVELLLLLLLGLLGLVGRVLLRRPWTLEARASSGRVVTRTAVGWRGSRAALTALAADAGAGRL